MNTAPTPFAATASVDDVAAAFFDALGPMPPKKLQKLVYYAQAWHLAKGQGPLFSNPVQAWVQGPVVRHLYDRHRGQWMVQRWPDGTASDLHTSARAIINDVIRRYGHLTGDELSELTHLETPWAETRGDLAEGDRSERPIPVQAMADYYGHQIASPHDAVRHAVSSAALEGLHVPAGYEAVLLRIAQGDLDADEVVDRILKRYANSE